jgi:hypothetical protein
MRKDIPNLTNLPPNIAQRALNNLSAGNQPMQPVASSAKQALWLVIAFVGALLLFAFLNFGLR